MGVLEGVDVETAVAVGVVVAVTVGLDVLVKTGVAVPVELAVEVEEGVFTAVNAVVEVEVGVLRFKSGLTGDCRLRFAQAKAPAIRPKPNKMIQKRTISTPQNLFLR